tara:strand:+ start:271 stop:900 length:630 start_codon:yes stop_codon:yes gene_type:complete
MKSQWIIEYMNDVPLHLHAIRVGIEKSQDVGSLLDAVSDNFMRISESNFSSIPWVVASQGVIEINRLLKKGLISKALEILVGLEIRCNQYVNLKSADEVEVLFKASTERRAELVLSTSLKMIPDILDSIRDLNPKTFEKLMGEMETVERYMLCQATNNIISGMRFGKIRRAMQKLNDKRSLDLTKVKFELSMLKQQIAELRGTLRKVAA